MIHPSLVIALAIFAKPPVVQQEVGLPAATTQETNTERALAETVLSSDIALLRRLDTPWTAVPSFDQTPAGEIIAAIRNETGVRIAIDQRALGTSGGWELKPVTCEPSTPRAALDAVVRELSWEDDAYRVDVASGIVVITDTSGQRTLRTTARYTLDDLLNRISPRDRRGNPGDDDIAGFTLATAKLRDFMLTVDSESWVENGGDLASVEFLDNVASVKATPALHSALRTLFDELARALPAPTMEWTSRIVEFTPEASDAEVAASLADDVRLQTLIDVGQASILAAPKVLALRTEPAEITIGNESESFTIKIEPAVSPGQDIFLVRATFARKRPTGDTVSSVVLRAVSGLHAACVIEIPGESRPRRLLLDALGVSHTASQLLRNTAPRQAPVEDPAPK